MIRIQGNGFQLLDVIGDRHGLAPKQPNASAMFTSESGLAGFEPSRPLTALALTLASEVLYFCMILFTKLHGSASPPGEVGASPLCGCLLASCTLGLSKGFPWTRFSLLKLHPKIMQTIPSSSKNLRPSRTSRCLHHLQSLLRVAVGVASKILLMLLTH